MAPYLNAKLESIRIKGYNFDVGSYLSKSIDMFKSDAGNFVIFTIAFFAISFLSIIPFIGILISLVTGLLSHVFRVGPGIAARAKENGNSVDLNTFFRGFDKLGELIILALIQFALVIPFILILIGGAIFAGVGVGALTENPEAVGLAVLTILPLVFFIGILIGIFYSLMMFAPFLVVFHNLSAWDSITTSINVLKKKVGYVIIFMILTAIVGLAGVMLCGVGLLATYPIMLLMPYYAFKDIIGFEEDEDGEEKVLDHLIV